MKKYYVTLFAFYSIALVLLVLSFIYYEHFYISFFPFFVSMIGVIVSKKLCNFNDDDSIIDKRRSKALVWSVIVNFFIVLICIILK